LSCLLFAAVIIIGLMVIIWIVHQYHLSQRE
jgi:hypothetical protein